MRRWRATLGGASKLSRGDRPAGEVTRGKTARNRMRGLDAFLLAYDAALLRRRDGLFAEAVAVDLGYGDAPFTTLESAALWRREAPELRVVGVEIDPERVARAAPWSDARTEFRLGGFNLPIEAPARLVRAMNVLRQYGEEAVAPAYAELVGHVVPGGVLLEGTSDPFGGLWVVNVLRRVEAGGQEIEPWHREALVFGTHLRDEAFREGFDPAPFQAVLPKSFIHRMVPGEPIHNFFAAWSRAAREVSAWRAWGARRHFAASVRRLAELGYRVRTQRKWLRRGWLVWEIAAGMGQEISERSC